MAEPFRFEMRPTADGVIEIQYSGFLGAKETEPLRELERLMSGRGPSGLYYDVVQMTGFDRAQVRMYADGFQRLTGKILGVALVGANTVIRFGAVTLSLITRLKVQTFDSRAEALAWLATLKAPGR